MCVYVRPIDLTTNSDRWGIVVVSSVCVMETEEVSSTATEVYDHVTQFSCPVYFCMNLSLQIHFGLFFLFLRGSGGDKIISLVRLVFEPLTT